MTREEAIKVLKRMKYPYNCNARKMIISNVDRDNEALDMAIQALSQECVEPTQKHVGNALDMRCDDAISRQAVLNCFKKWQPYTGTRLWNFEKELSELPPVTQMSDNKYRKEAKRWKNKWLKLKKSGKWIRTPLLTCDRCNKINKSGEETDYCPNCGAKMVEEQERSK